MTAENRAAIRNLPARAGRALHRRRHLRADDDRRGGRAGAARAHPGVPRARDVPDAARLRVHPHRRRHRAPAGQAGRRRARLPVGGQRPDPPGDRGRRADARDPGHADRLPGRRGRARAPRCRPSCASPAPCYVRYNARPRRWCTHAPFELGRAEVLGRGRRRRGPHATACWCRARPRRARRSRRAGVGVRLVQPAHARAARRGGDPARRASLPRCWSPSRITSWSAGSTRSSREMLVRHRVSVPRRRRSRLDERWFRPALLADVLEHEGFSAPRLAARFKKALAEHGGTSRRRAPAPAAVSLAGGMSANRIAFNPEYPSIASSDVLYARAAQLIPARYADAGQGPRAARARRRAQVPARGQGRARLGRRRQRVHRHDHGRRPARRSATATRPSTRRSARSSRDGITFSLMHPLEVEVAELVRGIVPGAEMVRFSKTGCDVTTAAVRLARAFTGRDKVALLRLPRLARLVHRRHRPQSRRPRGRRGADLTRSRTTTSTRSPTALDDDTACVILEPMTFEEPRDGFLDELKRLCARERRAAHLRRDVDRLPAGARRRAGALRRHRRPRPASRRRSPTACRSRCSPDAPT